MSTRAAVILTAVFLCLVNSVGDAWSADYRRGYLSLAFSIRDPYIDTTGIVTPTGTDECPDGLPMRFALYRSETDTAPVWEEDLDCVYVDDADYVRVLLGESAVLSSEVVTSYDVLYLEVTIDGDIIRPRILVVFSDYVLTTSSSSTSPGTVSGAPGSGDDLAVVYNAEQGSLGPVGVGSDTLRPRIVIFGDGPRSNADKLTQSEILAHTARQLLHHQHTIAMLRSEVAKLKDAAPEENR